jgi:hypothetical protein
LGKNPIADDCSDQAQNDVGDNSVSSATHQLARNPACDEADDNCSDRMQRYCSLPGDIMPFVRAFGLNRRSAPVLCKY